MFKLILCLRSKQLIDFKGFSHPFSGVPNIIRQQFFFDPTEKTAFFETTRLSVWIWPLFTPQLFPPSVTFILWRLGFFLSSGTPKIDIQSNGWRQRWGDWIIESCAGFLSPIHSLEESEDMEWLVLCQLLLQITM